MTGNLLKDASSDAASSWYEKGGDLEAQLSWYLYKDDDDDDDDGVDRQLVRMGYRLLVRGCKGL